MFAIFQNGRPTPWSRIHLTGAVGMNSDLLHVVEFSPGKNGKNRKAAQARLSQCAQGPTKPEVKGLSSPRGWGSFKSTLIFNHDGPSKNFVGFCYRRLLDS